MSSKEGTLTVYPKIGPITVRDILDAHQSGLLGTNEARPVLFRLLNHAGFTFGAPDHSPTRRASPLNREPLDASNVDASP